MSDNGVSKRICRSGDETPKKPSTALSESATFRVAEYCQKESSSESMKYMSEKGSEKQASSVLRFPFFGHKPVSGVKEKKRPEQQALSNIGAIIIQASAMFGVAPLIFPFLLVELGGIVPFMAVMLFLMALLFYCLTLLQSCTSLLLEKYEEARDIVTAEEIKKDIFATRSDYEEEGVMRDILPVLMELAGGKKIRFITIVILCIVFVANALGDLLVAADTMKTAVSLPFAEVQSLRLWIFILAIVSLPISYFGYFKDLVITASFGFMGTFCCGLCVIVSTFYAANDSKEPILTDDRLLDTPDFSSVMSAIGQFLFAMGGSGLLLPNLMCEMENHRYITFVMLTPFLFVGVCYTAIALPPYMVFRNLVRPNILSTLRRLEIREYSTYFDVVLLIAQLSVVIHLISQLVVWMNTVFQIVEQSFHCPKKLCWQRIAVRTAGITFITILGLCIPQFEPVLTFIGGVMETLLLVAMPVYMYWSIFQETISIKKRFFFCGILSVAVMIMVSTVIVQIQHFVSYWSSTGPSPSKKPFVIGG